jgi:hypothetical protein
MLDLKSILTGRFLSLNEELRNETVKKIKRIIDVQLNTCIPDLDKITPLDLYAALGMMDYRLKLISDFDIWLMFKTGKRFVLPDEIAKLRAYTQQTHMLALQMIQALEQHAQDSTKPVEVSSG